LLGSRGRLGSPYPFRAGRRAFLERLLATDAIFLTGMFRDRLEARARGNLAAEVAAL